MQPEVREFLAWGQDEPLAVRSLARMLAVSTRWTTDLLEAVRTGKGLERLGPRPPVQEWLALYRQHRRLENFAAKIVAVEDGTGAMSEEYREKVAWVNELRGLTPEQLMARYPTPEAAEELQRRVMETKRYMDEVIERRNSQVEKLAATGRFQGNLKAADVITLESQFWMCVWFPCLLLYGEHPGRLLHRARSGRIEALEKLLRLDKMVVGDGRIAYELQRSRTENPVRFQRIATAFSGNIEEVSQKEMKRRLAALMSKTLNRSNPKVRLTGDKIQGLFNVVERVRSNGEWLYDRDLPATPDGVKKDLQRRRAFWKI